MIRSYMRDFDMLRYSRIILFVMISLAAGLNLDLSFY